MIKALLSSIADFESPFLRLDQPLWNHKSEMKHPILFLFPFPFLSSYKAPTDIFLFFSRSCLYVYASFMQKTPFSLLLPDAHHLFILIIATVCLWPSLSVLVECLKRNKILLTSSPSIQKRRWADSDIALMLILYSGSIRRSMAIEPEAKNIFP